VTLRRVALPSGIEGSLLLYAMPGRGEALERTWRDLADARVDVIVSLASLDETRLESPEYAAAIVAGTVPCERLELAAPDYGVPEDRSAFCDLVLDVAARLRAGQRVLVHCSMGIGRTGTLAVCVLVALGEPVEDAERVVSAAGSTPMSREQGDLVAWYASRSTQA
jgi:protein-tyrosine phosphatase